MVYVMKESTAEYYLRRRVTLSEFLEITENTETQYELIDGEIYFMASPCHAHQVAIREIFGQFYNFFKGKACSPIMGLFDVRLKNNSPNFEDDPNIVQPDILVICDSENIDGKGKYHGVPTLVVEVLSPRTRGKYMIKKLSLYANSGVQEYWIIDIDHGYAIVYSLTDGDVLRVQQYAFSECIPSWSFKGLNVETDLLIRSNKV
ncbi:Uma2 family endonuclease [Fusibacter tunisiensis]|nr:Uma2 family endonuclease [Fusibacter tunisiensis]